MTLLAKMPGLRIYDRSDLVQYAVKSALGDQRVTDAVIVDDGLREALYLEMAERLQQQTVDITEGDRLL